jgi:DNA mismatch repair protein MutL
VEQKRSLAREEAQKPSEESDFFVEAKPLADKLSPSPQPAVQEVILELTEETKEQAPEDPVAEEPVQMDLFEEKMLSVENRARYQLIGQVFNTYWLVQFEDKLFIIDQHAAHEKVKYERLMKQYREHQVLSQTLMPPVIVSLTGQEEVILREYEETFAELGFEVEAFGGSEYALRSVPVDLYGCGEKEICTAVRCQHKDIEQREDYHTEKINSRGGIAALKHLLFHSGVDGIAVKKI